MSKNPFFKKSLKIASTLVVILTFILGANTTALANPNLQIEPLEKNNPGTQELPQDNFEDFLTSDLDSDADYEDALTSGETLIDEERLHFFSLTMPQLENRERNIIVYLPSGYQTDDNSYPVIYVLDAKILFIQPSFSPGDRILNDSLFQFYTRGINHEAIIVAIESDPIYVWDEYSPWVNQNMYLWVDPYEANQVEGGEGDAFLDFMEQTLKPSIDERYRTLTDRENTSIAGSKMGGLLSIYAGLTRPEIYSNVMAISPAVWFAESGGKWLSNNRLIKFIEQKDIPVNVKFFLDVTKEDRTTDPDVRPAVSNLTGDLITFSQAYLEGTQSVVNRLVENGLPHSNLFGGLANPTEWTDKVIDNPNTISGESTYLSFLPMIMEPDTTFEGCPDSGSCLITFSMNMSPYLNRTRNITVYLPPNYNSGNFYPVIYHTDAQHIFGTQIAPAIIDDVDWKMDEILDIHFNNTGRGIIAVGVWYDYDYPWSEYTITPNRNMDHWVNGASQLTTPEGGGMINFIRYILKPEIDSRFHTLTDREHTAIGGGSRHALLGLYAGLLAPETFSRVMSFSPAIWIAESKYEAHVTIPGLTTWYAENGLQLWLINHQAPIDVKYFLYVGTNEVSGLHYPYVEKEPGSGDQISIQYAYESGYVRVTGALHNEGIPTANKYFIHNPGGTHLPKIWRAYLIPYMLPFFGY